MGALREQLSVLCRDRGVTALYVFGSRAAEALDAVRADRPLDPGAGSDLDIAALTPRGVRLDARDRARLASALEDLLGAPRVDLVLLPEAPAFLALAAIEGELLLDRDPDETARFELYVMRRAGDLAFFERARRRAVLGEGAR
jgi:predicted nucleotidyltransferase